MAQEDIELGHEHYNGPKPRNAGHVAVLSVEADENIPAGCLVKLIPGTDKVKRHTGNRHEADGCIDPFLYDPFLKKGRRCWMFMWPNTVRNLRHVWSHTSIDDEDKARKMSKAEAYVRELADNMGTDYDRLMAEAEDYRLGKGYGFALEGDEPADIFQSERKRFWEAYEAITGHAVPDSRKDAFVRCYC